MDFKQHLESFSKLLDNVHIAEFLRKDLCGALCDKYHLIIVFQFFMRAEFREEDYTPRNFFLALTISHDLYDESKFLKRIILAYYLSRNDGFKDKSKVAFHWNKLVLFRRMQFKGLVERRICKNLCQLVKHRAFDKRRRELHTGYITNKTLCDKCKCPTNIKLNKNDQDKDVTDEKSDESKTPCNMEDTSDIITEQKAKKTKKNITDKVKKAFFRDCEPKLFAIDANYVTF